MEDDLETRIKEEIEKDKTLGCGPSSASTGPNDPMLPICTAHDLIDDAVNVGDPNYTHALNDWYFSRNKVRRLKALEFLKDNYPDGRWRLALGRIESVLYPPAIAIYRVWQKLTKRGK